MNCAICCSYATPSFAIAARDPCQPSPSPTSRLKWSELSSSENTLSQDRPRQSQCLHVSNWCMSSHCRIGILIYAVTDPLRCLQRVAPSNGAVDRDAEERRAVAALDSVSRPRGKLVKGPMESRSDRSLEEAKMRLIWR